MSEQLELTQSTCVLQIFCLLILEQFQDSVTSNGMRHIARGKKVATGIINSENYH